MRLEPLIFEENIATGLKLFIKKLQSTIRVIMFL